MTKHELRKIYRLKRSELSDGLRKELDEILMSQVLETVKGFRSIGLFLPINKFHEINLMPLLRNKNFQWFAPKSNFENGTMNFVQVDADTRIFESQFGIPEPESNEFISPEMLDAIVVPMFVADKNGFRVGYGKGFYDRFLAKCRPDCLRIGLSYFSPIELISDTGEHDEKVDICLTAKVD